MASIMHFRAGSTIARASSGSRSSISSVEPLMSANSAVTVLRSPLTVVEFSSFAGVTRISEAEIVALGDRGGKAGASATSEVPQSPQNRLAVGLSAPHLGQRLASGPPQSPQNLFPSGFSDLQL